MPDEPFASVYILAAGHGQRAGAPKALADLDGKPLLERQLSFACAMAGADAVFASIQEPWLPAWREHFPDVHFAGVDPDAPAMASLIALLKLQAPSRPGFVYHVDMPLWEPRLYAALLKALRPGWDAVVPRYQGRKGHPALLSAKALAAVAGLDPLADRLDAWLHGHKAETLDVPFSCVTQNWNYGVPR